MRGDWRWLSRQMEPEPRQMYIHLHMFRYTQIYAYPHLYAHKRTSHLKCRARGHTANPQSVEGRCMREMERKKKEWMEGCAEGESVY